jgi:hypothetical protein
LKEDRRERRDLCGTLKIKICGKEILVRKLPINKHVWRNRFIGTCNIFNDTVSRSEFVASNDWMIVNNQLEWIWKARSCPNLVTTPEFIWKC